MYHVSAQDVDERMIIGHYYYKTNERSAMVAGWIPEPASGLSCRTICVAFNHSCINFDILRSKSALFFNPSCVLIF